VVANFQQKTFSKHKKAENLGIVVNKLTKLPLPADHFLMNGCFLSLPARLLCGGVKINKKIRVNPS
jgi:hypothetical protein